MTGSPVLDDHWIAAATRASADLDRGTGRSGVVAVAIGKKQQAILDIVDGRVVGAGDEESIAVTVPLTADQLAGFGDGSASLARAYMMGDVKPVGSTGALLALIELFENPDFRDRLQLADEPV